MTARTLLLPAASAAALGLSPLPAAAQADTLLSPAPQSGELAAGGGWLAWSQRTDEGRFRLVLRAPDGTVAPAPVPDFGAPPNATIGSDRTAAAGRRLLVAYARCEGDSAFAGCDVKAYDLAGSGGEFAVPGLSTATYSETEPSLSLGGWSFVRRGDVNASRKGVFLRSGRGTVRRISPTLARETAFNGSRVAFTFRSAKGAGLIVRRVSGEGPDIVPVSRSTEQVPQDLGLTRYQAVWRMGETAFSTTSFGGSGRPRDGATAVEHRTVAGLASAAVGASVNLSWFLDPEGVKKASPSLFR